ncbi:haloacid dehalogenase superfamily, subfamily IA, variant 3 with third motif having DD or ED [Kaistia soli DSM 19436]|uniref:Haloacid dehalogenase superfamily, subfamily IA, variant 3 with third motif having DD or ED n=1 Tax=Kaistia soli DSM 19436 TaxID=1122133 RepID=A0A1M4WEN7_9HYPH|nr:HAD family hydrolase [Kaistia soli]SHE79751.1 haloacid dehalogenase superfamily, subfamily IA, variant 3 with third motif having DD or ED [Kaistia soli DSM 19436]
MAPEVSAALQPYDLVIFDCDGVLIDSEFLACRIDAEELTRLGYPITMEEVVLRFTGLSAGSMRIAVEADWGQKLPDDFDDVLQARIKDGYRRELQAIDGIDALLAGLAQPFCVASSSQPEKLRLGLELTGLWPRFHPNIFSASMVKNGKPAPDLFLHAASAMGHAPHRCVVVEDSLAGVAAGIAAGMQVIGFTGGRHCSPGHGDRLRDAGATFLAQSASEIGSILAV